MHRQGLRVLGYLRVSTEEQGRSGAGIEAQRAAIELEADRRGWEVIEMIEDRGYSARDLKRPGVQAALDALREGHADALVVSKLDRLSRSMVDFAGLMQVAQKQSWGLVALDADVDTTTAAGEALVSLLAVFAQFERRLIGQRTRDALAAKKAEGVRLGRPTALPPEVRRRIVEDRLDGKTFRVIADQLNQEGVPTAHDGKQWWPATVRAVLVSADADDVEAHIALHAPRHPNAMEKLQ